MSVAVWGAWERRLGAEGWAVCGAEAVARPADLEQTVAVVRWAGEEGTRIRVGGGGGGAGPAQRADATPALGLDLSRMRRLRFYEPGDLTAGWDAGATAAEVNAVLGRQGQFLPLDGSPGDGGSLGAICAAQRSGPLRHGYGTVRDFVIGIEAVTAAGAIVHGGGRVVKNVAGYDLMRLLIGSRGTLAVITGVNCKVFPALSETETVAFALPDLAAAERLRTRLLHSPLRLLALELTNTPVAGAAAGPYRALARFQGSAAVRARYHRELAAVGEEVAVAAQPVAAEGALWTAWEAEPMSLAIGAPSGAAVELLRRTEEMAAKAGRVLRFRGRLGLGVFSLQALPAWQAEPGAGWRRQWRAMAARVHADAWLRSPEDGADAAGPADGRDGGWMRRLKQHLDPGGVLGPAPAEADR
ncbi:MAG: FAD-binding oxidoreductase [Terriglobales bacterium]